MLGWDAGFLTELVGVKLLDLAARVPVENLLEVADQVVDSVLDAVLDVRLLRGRLLFFLVVVRRASRERQLQAFLKELARLLVDHHSLGGHAGDPGAGVREQVVGH